MCKEERIMYNIFKEKEHTWINLLLKLRENTLYSIMSLRTKSAVPTKSRQNCTVLYCTVLYYNVLYCTVLYCTVLYCTVQVYLEVSVRENVSCGVEVFYFFEGGHNLLSEQRIQSHNFELYEPFDVIYIYSHKVTIKI